MTARRALVIGGSLGGLLAAHLLRREGFNVSVFERNPDDLTGRGAGISTHPQLLDILARIGIDFDESMGVKLDTIFCLDRSGRVYLKENTDRTMSSWGRLYRSLRDAAVASRALASIARVRLMRAAHSEKGTARAMAEYDMDAEARRAEPMNNVANPSS